MLDPTHFRIDYLLRGSYKQVIVRAEKMNNAEAWHWATVDAGIGLIPKYRNDPSPKLTKPQAEKLGVTNVEWNPA